MNQSIWAEKATEPAKAAEPSPVVSEVIAPAPDTSAPPPDDSSADMYAPTGAQTSDLFDDMTPIESMRIRSDDDLFSDDFTPAAQPIVEEARPQVLREGGENTRSTARGRGRGRGSYEGRAAKGRGVAHRGARGAEDGQRGGREQAQAQAQAQAPVQSTPTEQAQSSPRQEIVPSVRGDRQATGGLRKPKLTEEELAEKMAKIQIKNASLTAAHARAEADAASFAEREQRAKQRQKEERKTQQQMMGEREKNRLRKLKAIGGREWDAEKNDDDFSKGGRHDQRGGFSGDQDNYTDGREYLYREPRGGDRGRGGGRGGRGGRPREVAAPKMEDFPALSSSIQTEAGKLGSGEVSVDPGSIQSSGKSWADQVEGSPTT